MASLSKSFKGSRVGFFAGAEYRDNVFAQLRQFALDHFPQHIAVDTEIRVHKDVAHADDPTPGHLGMLVPKCLRQTARRFAYDLEVMRQSGLNQFVRHEGVPALGGMTSDALDGLEDVVQALTVVPQFGTASPRTRVRIRGDSPFSLTTSTLQPSTS